MALKHKSCKLYGFYVIHVFFEKYLISDTLCGVHIKACDEDRRSWPALSTSSHRFRLAVG